MSDDDTPRVILYGRERHGLDLTEDEAREALGYLRGMPGVRTLRQALNMLVARQSAAVDWDAVAEKIRAIEKGRQPPTRPELSGRQSVRQTLRTRR